MKWRCDDNFLSNLDKLTLGMSKGAALALITYLVIKAIGVAHDNEWGYLLTDWGKYFTAEIVIGTIIPLVLFTYAIRNQVASVARFSAFIAVFGIVMNRLNTALVAYNWKLYQEIPHWREFVIALMVYAAYIVVYRAVLARMPILYTWKDDTLS